MQRGLTDQALEILSLMGKTLATIFLNDSTLFYNGQESFTTLDALLGGQADEPHWQGYMFVISLLT